VDDLIQYLSPELIKTYYLDLEGSEVSIISSKFSGRNAEHVWAIGMLAFEMIIQKLPIEKTMKYIEFSS